MPDSTCLVSRSGSKTTQQTQFKQAYLNALYRQKLTQLVDGSPQCVCQSSLHLTTSFTNTDYKCILIKMGSPLGWVYSAGQVVPFGVNITHQPARAQSTKKCLLTLFTNNQEQTPKDNDRQRHLHVLHNHEGEERSPSLVLKQWNYGIVVSSTGSIPQLLTCQDFRTSQQTHSAGSSPKNTSGK